MNTYANLSINRYKSHFKRAEFWHRTGLRASVNRNTSTSN